MVKAVLILNVLELLRAAVIGMIVIIRTLAVVVAGLASAGVYVFHFVSDGGAQPLVILSFVLMLAALAVGVAAQLGLDRYNRIRITA